MFLLYLIYTHIYALKLTVYMWAFRLQIALDASPAPIYSLIVSSNYVLAPPSCWKLIELAHHIALFSLLLR